MTARRCVSLLAFATLAVVAGCGSTEDGRPAAPPADAGVDADASHDAGMPRPDAPDAATADDAGVDAHHSPCDGLPHATWTIKVTDAGFDPPARAICPGDTVTWVWEGGSNSVTSGGWCSADGIFASGYYAAPHSFSVTFKEPAGLFPYYSEADCQNLIGAILIVR